LGRRACENRLKDMNKDRRGIGILRHEPAD
jgi:hypothetical protein